MIVLPKNNVSDEECSVTVYPPGIASFLEELHKYTSNLTEHSILNTDSEERYYVNQKGKRLLTLYQFRSLNETALSSVKVICAQELLSKHPDMEALFISYIL